MSNHEKATATTATTGGGRGVRDRSRWAGQQAGRMAGKFLG